MEPIEYDAMYELEDNLWWYRGQRAITKALFDRYLPRTRPLKILDAGAGTGGSLELLNAYGEVTPFDFYDLAVAHYYERSPGRIARASITHMPYRDETFDLVTVFDVLAILLPEEERLALSEVARVLKPGGFLFWREPAHMFLYGPHDRATHARHRYNRGEFRERLAIIGLKPVHISYSNSFLFPVAAGRRIAARFLGNSDNPQSDVRPVPGPLNSILGTVLAAEAPIASRYSLPMGLSVLALARKQ